jgi:hypothetical protein
VATNRAVGARIARSALRLATDCTVDRLEFESQNRRESCPFHVVQTGSEARPPSYLVSAGDTFPGLRGTGVQLNTHLQLVLVSRSRTRGCLHPIPHTCSWRSAYVVKHKDNFTFAVIGGRHLHRVGLRTRASGNFVSGWSLKT